MAEVTNMLSSFGSVGDVATAENQGIRARALEVAKLGRGEAGAYVAGLGSGMLMEGLAGMAGMKTRTEKKQETIQGILEESRDLDPNDPKTLIEMSRKFLDNGLTQLSQQFAERARTLTDTLADNTVNKQVADAKTSTAASSALVTSRPTIEVGNPENPAQTIKMELNPASGEYEPILDKDGNYYVEDKFTSQLTGNLSQDFIAILDGDGKVIGAKPIEGSPADIEAKELASTKAFKIQYEITNVSRQLENVDKVMELYNKRSTTKKAGGFEVSADEIFGTAAKAVGLTGIPGTPRYAMQEALAPIIANIGFDKLDAMRKSSPTGGALGQVSNIELAALQKSIASLSLDNTPEEFYANVLKVQRHYSNMMKLMDANSKGLKNIEDLQLDNKYEVTYDEITKEPTVTLLEREEDQKAF